VVVVGGGLTAIDTATESLAYYLVADREVSDALRGRCRGFRRGRGGGAKMGTIRSARSPRNLAHSGAPVRKEPVGRRARGREARVVELLQHWGGVTIAYRRRPDRQPFLHLKPRGSGKRRSRKASPFSENLSPVAVDVDNYGAVRGIRFTRPSGLESSEHWLPAHTVFVAAGTQPNTVLAREQAGFSLDGKYFQACDEDGRPVETAARDLEARARRRSAIAPSRRDAFVSFFGDLHPSYFGNVVKALGSARQGYPVVSRALARKSPQSKQAPAGFLRIAASWRRFDEPAAAWIMYGDSASKVLQPGVRTARAETFAREAPSPHPTMFGVSRFGLRSRATGRRAIRRTRPAPAFDCGDFLASARDTTG